MPPTVGANRGPLQHLSGEERGPSGSDLTAIRAKFGGPLLRARITVVATGGANARPRQLVERVLAVLRSRHGTRGRVTTRRLRGSRLLRACATPGQSRRTVVSVAPRLLLSPEEAVGVLGWPVAAPTVPGLIYGTAPLLMPSDQIPGTGKGRLFADSNWPSARMRSLVQPVAGASVHSLLLGPSGVGKSTLLVNLAIDDLRQGRGLVFLDLKGDAATDLLGQIPERRRDDVVVLDPTTDLPLPGLKVLGTGDPELAADQLLGSLRAIFAQRGGFGVYSDLYLRLGLSTLAHDPDATLADLTALFSSPAFRRRVLRHVTDPRLLSQWAAFDQLSPASQAEQVAAPLRRINEIVGRRTVRAVLAQARPLFDMKRVLAERKVVIVSLSPGRLGGPAVELLGSLLVWEIYSAVLGRQALPESDRSLVNLYIDEPKLLASLPVPLESMFELFRSMQVGVTMAGQSITQLPKELQRAALTNAATLAVFRQHAKADADLLARELAGVAGPQLQHLGPHEIVLRLGLDAGYQAPTATGITRPLPEPVSDPQDVRRHSAARFGRTIEAVDQALADRHGTSPADHAPSNVHPSEEDSPFSFGRRQSGPRRSS